MRTLILTLLEWLPLIGDGILVAGKSIAVIAAVAGLIELLFDPKGAERVGQLLGNVVRGVMKIATPLLREVEKDIAPVVRAFADSISENGKPLVKMIDKPLDEFASAAFGAATKSLESHRDVQPNQWRDIASTAFADAVKFGLGSYVVSNAFEAVFPEKLNSLNSLGPLLSTLAGFEEVTSAWLGPTLFNGITLPARYDAASRFRSMQPILLQAELLLARRKIVPDEFALLAGYAGLARQWEAPVREAAFRPVSPFILRTAFVDVPFPTADVRHILEDNGYSPRDVNVMLLAFRRLSVQSAAKQVIASAMKLWAEGYIDDTARDDALAAADRPDESRSLELRHAMLERIGVIAARRIRDVAERIAGGLISDADGEATLESAGIAPWRAALEIADASDRAEIRATRLAASEARKAEILRERQLTAAAVSQYRDGTLDDAGLTAALAAIPLSPMGIASIVTVQHAARVGRLRSVYGLELDPPDAKLLLDRVAAIKAQEEKELVKPDEARRQLLALGIPEDQADALLAEWAAARGKLNLHGSLLSPLSGKPE